jgi:uncharacterized membrane protein YkvA (DUF1232 family)
MSEPSSSSDLRGSAGVLGGLVKQARLAWRLLNDGRVPGWIKLIPIAGIVYFLSPIDLIPDLMLPGLGEIDDVVVILLALKMLVELSPPGIVREHVEDLLGRSSGATTAADSSPEPYIDASYRILEPDKEHKKGESS